MRELPIIFPEETISAILDGVKTQTRRLKGLTEQKSDWAFAVSARNDGNYMMLKGLSQVIHLSCPYGQPGDRLWVRETWCVDKKYDSYKPSEIEDCAFVWYSATDNMNKTSAIPGKWRPSVYMPRWASRIILEIDKIRLERLQDITLNEINAEGTPYTLNEKKRPFGSRREQFQRFWDAYYAKKGFPWVLNPFVWVIEFKVIQKELA